MLVWTTSPLQARTGGAVGMGLRFEWLVETKGGPLVDYWYYKESQGGLDFPSGLGLLPIESQGGLHFPSGLSLLPALHGPCPVAVGWQKHTIGHPLPKMGDIQVFQS